jgi:MYXO-CTERM domain-containing protein
MLRTRRCLLVISMAFGLVGSPVLLRAALAQLSAEAAMKFTSENFITGVTQPVEVGFLPDGRTLVLRRMGEIIVVRKDGTRKNNAATVPVMPAHNEQGLLGVAVDPGFAQNKTIYLFASMGANVQSKHKVLKATVADDDTITVDLQKPIVDMGLEGPQNHNGGTLVIHKNHLYISVGDTGGNSTPPTNKYSSCLNKANGKILRVNLDGSIPMDNPLRGMAMVTGCDTRTSAFAMKAPDERIYAWGMRNPFRFWIDPMTDLLWIGDVGEETREEVSVGGMGTHFGYPFFEGTKDWTQSQVPSQLPNACMGMTPARPCTPPALDWGNKRFGNGVNGDDCAIGGTIPPAGCGWPTEYTQKYFFGDHGGKRIYTADLTADRKGLVPGSRKEFAIVGGVSSIKMGLDGALYAVIQSNNSVIRFIPKDRPANCATTTPPVAAADAGTPAPRDANAGTDAPRGTGGGAGTGGVAGTGGAMATGGAAGSPVGTGGNMARGGASGSGGGGAAAGTGGSKGGADSGADEMAKASDGGCGCRVGAVSGGRSAAALLLALGALVARRRRRR